ncbi:hypothetical protein [Horticoccus sp. 23ND18S-11]|uniref:hypothetical protein n=1 Tax=Horticoccus sp. 23ND18S-11 TaxID=3391832 RepID=UPI0039C8D40A
MKASFLPCLSLLIAVTGPLAAADSLGSALENGTVSLNTRLRYEGVEQTGLRSADALTLRTRLGFTTAPWLGFKAMAEGENIVAADGDAYSQSGLNAAGTGRAVVGDPETTEVNQLFIAYTTGQTSATLGRQRLVLDNARFIGDVGWRQNMQTFDAVVLQDKSLAKTTLTYGYLDQINRVFSRRHPQGRWKSDSHVVNANYTGFAAGTLAVYGYWLDFKHAAANSCATYGISFSGTQAVSPDVKVLYRAEAATQRDHGSSPLDYRASYVTAFAGLGFKPGTITVGYEQLGSDHNVGFKTPLATLHAVNGWADLFLTTPASGLEETFVKATASLPAALAVAASYHWFQSNVGSTKFGGEFDAQLTRKFGKFVTGMLKFANFRRDRLAFPNVQKVWAQVEVTY